jgi:uncharacterized beta-barrel protein YwiB (DUF1934 family)
MKLKELRNSLMTKALTVLGFSSPLALMACYGTPTTDYPSEAYIEVNELNGEKGDSTKLTVVAEGKWQVVNVPDFVTVSQDSGEGTAWITVKALEDNLTDELREGDIVIRDETGEQTISIMQLPANEVEEE